MPLLFAIIGALGAFCLDHQSVHDAVIAAVGFAVLFGGGIWVAESFEKPNHKQKRWWQK